MQNVVILGGGYAGMAAAFRLVQNGAVKPTIIERAPEIGGLSGSCSIDGQPIEKFYHHIKPEDRHVLDLAEHLGLADQLVWADTRMGFYIDGQTYGFSTGMDLLKFRPFRLLDKMRFALGVLRSKRVDGRSLEGISAKEWVIRDWGQTIYDRMMAPMLLNKFGISPERISAGFLHGRIKGLSSAKKSARNGEQFAYILGSNQVLAERMTEHLQGKVELRTGAGVDRMEKTEKGFEIWAGGECTRARWVVNTLPLHVFERIPKNFDFKTEVEYQGVVCAIFAVKEELSSHYWLNVLDPSITFRVLVNQSRLAPYQNTVVYCANYVAADSSLYACDDDDILSQYRRDLEQMYGRVTVVDQVLSRTPNATPIFDRDFADKTAHLDTVAEGMVFAGNVKIYPGSRTVSSVIGTGYAAADRILAAAQTVAAG